MQNFKKVIYSNYYYIIYVFVSLTFDFFFHNTKFIGAIFLLIIPVWGLVFIKKQWGKFSPLHYVSFILCALVMLILFFHDNDITIYWCFGLKTWCFILAITSASREEQDKMYLFVPKLFICVTLTIHVLTVLSFAIVVLPKVFALLPNYFQRLVANSAVLNPRLVGFSQNSNSTAMISMIGIFCSIYCIVCLKKWRLISLATICSSIIVIFLTVCRGAMLSTLVFVVLFVVFVFFFCYKNFDSTTIKIYLLCFFVLLVLLTVCLVCFFLVQPFQDFVCTKLLRMPTRADRSSSELIKDIMNTISSGSGRDNLQKINMIQFKSSPIFGVSIAQLSNNPLSFPTHNGFFLALFTFGVPIFILYITLLIMLVFPAVKAFKYRDVSDRNSNILLSFIYALVLTSFLENSYEVVLLFYHNLENSFYFSIYVFAYIVGNRILQDRQGKILDNSDYHNSL